MEDSMTSLKTSVISVGAVLTLVVATSTLAAAQSTCDAIRAKAVGKAVEAEMKCYAKALRRGKDPEQICLHAAAIGMSVIFMKSEMANDCSDGTDAASTLTLIDKLIESYFDPESMSSPVGNCCAHELDAICEVGPGVSQENCEDVAGKFLANGVCQGDGSCAAP